jgi:hypothetical protein
MLGAQTWMTKYSRDYEKQADILGSHIMATAGYDPRDLANMFRTIAQQGGSHGPEWLSSHPDPGNRFDYINREASLLQVSPNPIKITRDFTRVQERLRSMPRARTMEQIQRSGSGGQGNNGGVYSDPTSGGRYSRSVPPPSIRMRPYSSGNWLRMSIPDNWQGFPATDGVQFAPVGGYGDQGITHGAMVGIDRSGPGNVQQATQTYVNNLLQSNPYLRQQSGYSRYNLSGRPGYMTTLSGRSSITGRAEIVTIYTAMLNNGDLFYVATVSPQDESYNYSQAFRNMLASIRVIG